MPQQITKYKVFLASPSDLDEERDSIQSVIDEINQTYGLRNNIIIELLKWETHSGPGITVGHVQDLIDSDIGNDYDLFIGILWKKFGSATDRFESGTLQEFSNAYERFTENPKSIQILFYFKNAPIAISEINTTEIEKINQFKEKLKDKTGILYWNYNENDELHKFLRIHIPMRIGELINVDVKKLATTKALDCTKPIDEEELGLLDYHDIFNTALDDSALALNRITEATSWVGGEITKKAGELDRIIGGRKEIGKKEMRDFCQRSAIILNDYASRIEPDIPIFFKNFELGSDAYTKMHSLHSSDFSNPDDGEQRKSNSESILSLVNSTKNATKGLKTFLESISRLPRLEKDLNKARRNVETKIEELLSKLDMSISISTELYKNA